MAESADPNGMELLIPPELEGGIYANAFLVWHTEHEFTLDFAVARADPEQTECDPLRGNQYLLVARLRIPVTLVFDVLLALNRRLTDYERAFGEIRRPERRDG